MDAENPEVVPGGQVDLQASEVGLLHSISLGLMD